MIGERITADNVDTLKTLVNDKIDEWRTQFFAPAPIEVIVDADCNINCILSQKLESDLPRDWNFDITDDVTRWARGGVFSNNASSQRGVVLFRGKLYYWGTKF
jgi:hypothetical protein